MHICSGLLVLLALSLSGPVLAQTPPSGASSEQLCIAGGAVSVLFPGEWYPAKVLDGPDGSNTCLVSYDGYDASWDEWVDAGRLRVAAETPAEPAAPQAKPAAPRPGVYNCYTMESGTLTYTYTDVRILDKRSYAVGDATGAYTFDQDGAMAFTGTLANATGKFSIKSTGTPQIDLVFDDDAWASMACSLAR